MTRIGDKAADKEAESCRARGEETGKEACFSLARNQSFRDRRPPRGLSRYRNSHGAAAAAALGDHVGDSLRYIVRDDVAAGDWSSEWA